MSWSYEEILNYSCTLVCWLYTDVLVLVPTLFVRWYIGITNDYHWSVVVGWWIHTVMNQQADKQAAPLPLFITWVNESVMQRILCSLSFSSIHTPNHEFFLLCVYVCIVWPVIVTFEIEKQGLFFNCRNYSQMVSYIIVYIHNIRAACGCFGLVFVYSTLCCVLLVYAGHL